MKPILTQLELPIVASCNLLCKGCTSFSDYNMKGIYDWEQLLDHIKFWDDRMTINGFSLLGGEPTMHPKLPEMIKGVRQINPRAFIQVVTNGTYLIKRPEIVDALAEVGHSLLSVTIHEPRKEYTVQTRKFLLGRYKWADSDTRNFLETDNRFYLEFISPSPFLKILNGEYGSAKPYNNDPKDAFSNCCFNTGNNAQLHYGKLYRCHPIALLPRMLNDWGQISDPDWQKYIAYKGLEQSATDDELLKFLDSLKQSEEVCSMCPSNRDSTYHNNPQWDIRPIAPYA